MAVAPPRVLTVAGSDSGGGAGIQADLKTMLAHGVHGMSVLAAVTAQNSLGVQGYWELPVEAVRAQLDSVLSDIGVDAVKTGMLASTELVSAVAEVLGRVGVPVVVDPVGVSKHGDSLLAPDAVVAVRERLLPVATLVTPNLYEVEPAHRRQGRLRGRPAPGGRGGARARPGRGAGQGRPPRRRRGRPAARPHRRVPARTASARLDNRHTHGTGCTLASAIASRLALGDPLPAAVAAAKEYVTGAIAHGFPLGSGIGPVDHAWRWR